MSGIHRVSENCISDRLIPMISETEFSCRRFVELWTRWLSVYGNVNKLDMLNALQTKIKQIVITNFPIKIIKYSNLLQ